MKKIMIFLAFTTVFMYATDQNIHKAVFDLTSGNAKILKNKVVWNIRMISDKMKDQNKTLKSIIVISGDAYKFFIKDLKNSPYNTEDVIAAQQKLEPILSDLQKNYDVKFHMCATGMKKRHINAATLYPYVEHKNNKVHYLIEAQNNGFAYIPFH